MPSTSQSISQQLRLAKGARAAADQGGISEVAENLAKTVAKKYLKKIIWGFIGVNGFIAILIFLSFIVIIAVIYAP
ncbi:MAG: hypothetical protein ABH881_03405 [bacterium]